MMISLSQVRKLQMALHLTLMDPEGLVDAWFVGDSWSFYEKMLERRQLSDFCSLEPALGYLTDAVISFVG